jgi:hypothetical protein
MKTNRRRIEILVICLLLTSITYLTSCEKITSKDLIGTWISTDLVDTIDFTTDKDLYKMFSGFRDHFDYSLGNDKIRIGYRGMLKILVTPTYHDYEFKNDQLTIDFRPTCYGFRSQEITFRKQ